MKNIKILLLLFAFLVVSIVSANGIEPNFKKQGKLIKGTFFYQDGTISQEGTYKDGKLHGQWISYDQNGKKTALANYTDGKKTGKWFFWSPKGLTEVDYANNKIVKVANYNQKEEILNKD
jgi:antitoxin component YwqK of YwqJK toxin-antitoxin module